MRKRSVDILQKSQSLCYVSPCYFMTIPIYSQTQNYKIFLKDKILSTTLQTYLIPVLIVKLTCEMMRITQNEMYLAAFRFTLVLFI